MLADAMSLCSSQGSEESSLVLHLMLTTFAGEEIQLAIDLQEYDIFHEFENAVLQQLPYLGDSSTFGCELQFVTVIRTPAKFWLTPFGTLCGTIIASTWLPNSALWMHYTKGTSRAKPKPFEFHPVRLIGYCLRLFLSTWRSDMFKLKQASGWGRLRGGVASDCKWSTCQTQLSACGTGFCNCSLLRVVVAPGRRHFGVKAFEACCSLTTWGDSPSR